MQDFRQIMAGSVPTSLEMLAGKQLLGNVLQKSRKDVTVDFCIRRGISCQMGYPQEILTIKATSEPGFTSLGHDRAVSFPAFRTLRTLVFRLRGYAGNILSAGFGQGYCRK